MKLKKDELSIAILLPLAVGTVSGFITRNAMAVFETMNKPPLSPPGLLFPVVWVVLYVLMGIASYLIYQSDIEKENVQEALKTYAAQLVFNFFWSILFFALGWYLVAFIWLLVMWVLIIRMLLQYYPINKTAAYLTIPYFVWVTFAAYLNLAVYLLN